MCSCTSYHLINEDCLIGCEGRERGKQDIFISRDYISSKQWHKHERRGVVYSQAIFRNFRRRKQRGEGPINQSTKHPKICFTWDHLKIGLNFCSKESLLEKCADAIVLFQAGCARFLLLYVKNMLCASKLSTSTDPKIFFFFKHIALWIVLIAEQFCHTTCTTYRVSQKMFLIEIEMTCGDPFK